MVLSFDEYKTMLEEIRARLVESEKQLQSEEQPQATEGKDDKASAINPKPPLGNGSNGPSYLKSLQQRIKRIDDALARIADEIFGTCLKCGRPIQHERLHNLPYAEHCLPCQQAHEKQLKHQ